VVEPVVEATILFWPPIVAIDGFWPGPMNGSVVWIAPFSLIGQPERNAPLAPLTA